MLAFQEKDAAFFFGRETFVDGLVRVAHQQPLLAVIGSSGSGKSSVVLAGLIPKLREAGSWLIESFRPNKQPFYELAAALISQLEPELGKTDKTIKAKELAESIRQHGFTADVSAILKDNPGKRLLLVVDQFEEVYTGCADTEQQQFVNALLAAVESASRAVTLVLTLRADFYSYVVNYPPFTEALNKYPAQNLSLMKVEEMQKAIELPAEKKGVKLEEGLRQRILDDVKQEPGNLPLLEFALTQLWEKQSRGLLTHQAYSEIGGVAKALSNHAEAVYGRLSKQEQKQAQRIFLQLVRPGEGTEDTRRVATPVEVGNWELVMFLAGKDARLIVTGLDEQTQKETVEVVHEALIREWGRLRGWIDKHRDQLKQKHEIEAGAKKWREKSKSKSYLLQGELLKDAKTFQKQLGDNLRLSELANYFVQESIKAEEEKKTEFIESPATLIFIIIFSISLLFLLKSQGEERTKVRHLWDTVIAAQGQINNSQRLDALQKLVKLGVSLDGANLNGANLKNADLGQANFMGANLKGADLRGADLRGANLKGADLNSLIYSRFVGKGYTRVIKTDLGSADLSNTNLGNASFNHANFSDTNLIGANLSGANLTYVYGLTPEQVKSADNWQQAIYDEDFRKKLFSK